MCTDFLKVLNIAEDLSKIYSNLEGKLKKMCIENFKLFNLLEFVLLKNWEIYLYTKEFIVIFKYLWKFSICKNIRD